MSELKTNKISTNDTNNVAIDTALGLKSYTTTQRNALTSVAGDMIYDTDEAAPYYYNGSAWKVMKDIIPPVVDYLVIAGGGGASSTWGAGSGAGGYISSIGGSGGGGPALSNITFTSGDSFTVTVGAGGSGRTQGSQSVFSTVSTIGGGIG